MSGLTARPLPYGDPAHLAAHQFLVEEAALLDAGDYEGWLGLLATDIRYLMPVRVTTARGAGFDALPDMGHFDEDLYALRKRVQRLATDHAWTEDPPSRTRHYVTNVRTFAAEGGSLAVESAMLLFRSRGDTREADLLSCGRVDLLRPRPEATSRPAGPEATSRPAGPEATSRPAGPEAGSRPEGPAGYLLARREITVDESVLRTQNLAIFL
jgi:phthalate 3,4-dioxygenase subunit beta